MSTLSHRKHENVKPCNRVFVLARYHALFVTFFHQCIFAFFLVLFNTFSYCLFICVFIACVIYCKLCFNIDCVIDCNVYYIIVIMQ